MTPEQIKVLEELRNEIGLFAAQLRTAKLGSEVLDVEVDALTAALEFIEDMRELEAAAEKIIFHKSSGYRGIYPAQVVRLSGTTWKGQREGERAFGFSDHYNLREAFKAVKGGKD